MGGKVLNLQEHKKKRFSDFAEEPKALDGDKVPIDSVLNKEIEIVGCRITTSKYNKNKSGKCLTLQFVDDRGDRHVIFTGSDVLVDQMKRYADEMPFVATIRKIDRYYTLT